MNTFMLFKSWTLEYVIAIFEEYYFKYSDIFLANPGSIPRGEIIVC